MGIRDDLTPLESRLVECAAAGDERLGQPAEEVVLQGEELEARKLNPVLIEGSGLF